MKIVYLVFQTRAFDKNLNKGKSVKTLRFITRNYLLQLIIFSISGRVTHVSSHKMRYNMTKFCSSVYLHDWPVFSGVPRNY